MDQVESINKEDGYFLCKNGGSPERIEHWNKILALPEYFSDKHLQAIVDGKMEDGDEDLNLLLDALLPCTPFPAID